ncbi:hypothetical protein [Nocardiopsis alborubida]|uniref:Uncharacterized protein n=1 Tax=Nocardiopsis alborubida TaxID=146802 RepID=A0A7X6MJ07_9ACTN|nr:hypothetical protein [Nocardiopsis alborubida]NKZ01901.1 hypothetical protein [Nocardiopsis alborubida]
MQRITAYLSSLLLSRRDDGYSTETVIITAALVGAAAVLVGAIGTRVDLEAAEILGG